MAKGEVNEDPEALLREARWLRRIAGALVGSGPAAADLAQDVHLAAQVGAAPRERGPRRAWMRTVARRIATRGAAREARRPSIEAEAGEERARATAEPADLAAERVALQRRLGAALAQLGPDDRALLVRRHFDGAAAPEIAAEIGVTPAAVRQRLVRATDRLRAEFARTDEEWRAWSPALALAAFGRESAATAAGLTSPSLSSLDASPHRSFASAKLAASPFITFTIMKKLTLAAAAVLALVTAAWLITEDADSGRPGDGMSTARGGMEPLDGLQAAGGADLGRVAAETERRALPSGSPGAAADVVVLDMSGRPIDGVRGAWVDGRTGAVTELYVDGEGRARRPEGATATIVLIGPRHRLTSVHVSSAREPAQPIRLADAPIIEGQLDVLGAPAGMTHNLIVDDDDDPRVSLATDSLAVRRILRSCPAPGTTTTDPSGRFTLVCRTREVGITIPEYVTIDGVELDGESLDHTTPFARIAIPVDTERVHVKGVMEPSMMARVVHEGSMDPYSGYVTLAFTDEGGEVGFSNGVASPVDGSTRFRTPLPMFGGGPDRRWVSLAVRVSVQGQHGVEVGRVALDPEDLPSDFGTFVIEELPEVALHVARMGPDGPESATNVRMDLGTKRHHLDGSGPWTIQWPVGAEATVFADRCRWQRVSLPANQPAQVRVVLEPAPALVVAPIAPSANARLRLRIELDPARPLREAEALPRPGWALTVHPPGCLGASSSVSVPGVRGGVLRWADLGLPVGQELIASGLIGDVTATARLIDASGRTLHVEEVPAGDHEEHRVEPRLDFEELARLKVEIEGADGPLWLEVQPGEEVAGGAKEKGVWVAGRTFEFGALAPGGVVVTVTDRDRDLRSAAVDVDLRPGVNHVVVEAPAPR